MGCRLAWGLLGSTLVVRSGEPSSTIRPEVHRLWGPPLEQLQPSASYRTTRTVESTRTVTDAQGRTSRVTSEQREPVDVPILLVSSDLRAHLALEHRRRGLLWFPTYRVDFSGRYVFENDDSEERTIDVEFPL